MSVPKSGPPDWALPGWDAVDPEEPVAVGPGGARPGPTSPAAAPGTFGLRILQVSEVTRAVRGAIRQDPAARRPVGRGRDRPGHGLERRPRLLRAQGRAQPAPVRVVPRRPRPLGVPAPRPACASSSTAASTCTSRPARCSSTSTRSSRRDSATSRSGSRRSRHASLPRGCSRRPGSGRCRPGRARSPSSPARRAPCGATSATCWPGAGRSSRSCSWPPGCRARRRRPAS